MGAGYTKRLTVRASDQAVFRSLATREGLRGWWTPLVRGSPRVGGVLRFRFKGLAEHIDMQVEESVEPLRVAWACKVHSSLPEWKGTRIAFDIEAVGADRCKLRLEHAGLVPALECYEDCSLGWEHFLGSIALYAETGRGLPFGGA